MSLEALQPLVVELLGGGERVLGAFEVLADGVDGARLAIGRDVGLHGRHPVAEKDVDVIVGERGIGDGHRQHLDVGLVAERVEDLGRDRGGGGDVRPADIREADQGAALGLALRQRRPGQRRGQHRGSRQHRHACHALPPILFVLPEDRRLGRRWVGFLSEFPVARPHDSRMTRLPHAYATVPAGETSPTPSSPKYTSCQSLPRPDFWLAPHCCSSASVATA